MARLLKN